MLKKIKLFTEQNENYEKKLFDFDEICLSKKVLDKKLEQVEKDFNKYKTKAREDKKELLETVAE